MKLTTADYATLDRAMTLRERFEAGIFPSGSSSHRHFAKLERLGLIEFEGWGYDIDRERDGDVPCYQLTKAGIDALAARETARLRRVIERPERCQFWGQWYTITPRLIARVFGDGKHLVCITPLATRPNYFVVRIDSSIKDVRHPFPANAQWSLLEDIMLAAEEEYGRFGIDDDGETIKGDDERYFPVVDLGIGCTWGRPFPVHEWKPTPRPRKGRAVRQPRKGSIL